jgi:hypothetical protein
MEMFFPMHVRAPWPNWRIKKQRSVTLFSSLFNGSLLCLQHSQKLTTNIDLSISFNCSASDSNQRSGLNTCESSPKTSGSICTTGAIIDTFVPAASEKPQSVAPSGGTYRSSGRPTPGCRRVASFIMACLWSLVSWLRRIDLEGTHFNAHRYGIWRDSSRVIGSEILPSLYCCSNCCLSLFITRGVLIR